MNKEYIKTMAWYCVNRETMRGATIEKNKQILKIGEAMTELATDNEGDKDCEVPKQQLCTKNSNE